jgi:hypothetical protein
MPCSNLFYWPPATIRKMNDWTRPISADEVRELEKLIGDTGTELERVLAYYKVAALAEMTETTYQRAIEVLNRKLANRRQRETVHAQD